MCVRIQLEESQLRGWGIAANECQAGFQLEKGAGRDDGLSLTKYPSIASQACSAAISVLKGEPMTFTADLF